MVVPVGEVWFSRSSQQTAMGKKAKNSNRRKNRKKAHPYAKGDDMDDEENDKVYVEDTRGKIVQRHKVCYSTLANYISITNPLYPAGIQGASV
jgi:hypothetical protein